MSEIDKIEFWLNSAEYDFKTAEAMFETKRFLYVGFMCHLTIEKTLKAYYIKVKNSIPPYTHNLQFLAEQSGIFYNLSEEQKDFIDLLQPLNIRARYPHSKDELFKFLTESKCKYILEKTLELMLWIKKKF